MSQPLCHPGPGAAEQLGHERPLLGDDLYATPAATAAVKSRAGLFLQSVEVKLRDPDRPERWVEVKADEAPKFQRVVERSLHGFEFARKEVGSI